MVKYLANTKSSLEIVGFLSLFTTIFLTPLALIHWVELNTDQISIIILISIIATIGHLTMTMAIKATTMTIIQPFTFLQLVWSVIAGIMLFDEKLDIFLSLNFLFLFDLLAYQNQHYL